MYEVVMDYESTIRFLTSEDLEHAAGHMQKVFDILYGEDSIDELENHLEEACTILSMPLPRTNLKIKKED